MGTNVKLQMWPNTLIQGCVGLFGGSNQLIFNMTAPGTYTMNSQGHSYLQTDGSVNWFIGAGTVSTLPVVCTSLFALPVAWFCSLLFALPAFARSCLDGLALSLTQSLAHANRC